MNILLIDGRDEFRTCLRGHLRRAGHEVRVLSDMGPAITTSRNVMVGTRLDCPTCGVELEVLSLSPFELDYADPGDYDDKWDEELEDDWDDEE